ncbi:GDSL esterase/lipase At5g03600 isoform X2 [Physcomitrium patens]|uniref:GDSL esterase/lipase At5g03600 isoform X2 n=1 Tax=Physcomitrium patens TaxID=3218 RepID=UPI000D15794D|nr:GDSL esterase/lipase At5g03600-like isoform X2 [Physcomitrium patens]|eukprot:XP_024359207.1 GDSL esterase/lipase At5g03600-like isoform X2 [Physcomitrella patens]
MEFFKLHHPAAYQLQLTTLRTFVAAVLLLLLCCHPVPAIEVNGIRFKEIFSFGDSYLDIGNRDPKNFTRTPVGPVNQAWINPYGLTNPAVPTGRFCDGQVFSDILGLHPRPYILYEERPSTRKEDGMNFAVGGSGVKDNLGFTKTRDQIAQLKTVINSGVYSETVYKESLILFTISGNDYYAFLRNSQVIGLAEIGIFIVAVVNQLVEDLKTLYNMGFRNFAVSTLPPLGCLPGVSAFTGSLSCLEVANVVSTTHNSLLKAMLTNSSSILAAANLIILDNELAFREILLNQIQTQFTSGLKACCKGSGSFNLCGDVDKATRTPLYTLCSANTISTYFFWDEVHPTQAGWRSVFNLFLGGEPFSFTNGKSLVQFLST